MNIEVKICGLTSAEAVASAMDNGARYLGFVFFPKSPRNLTVEKAADLRKNIQNAAVIAVTVNAEDAMLDEIAKELKPDYIQLHGDESVSRVKEIKEKYGVKVIKAIKVRGSDDIAKAREYEESVEMLLFDARPSDSMPGALPGGNGISFDWQLLKGREFSVPWMLSGGINEENVGEALKTTGAKIVDVSSSLEVEPGKKEPKLIESFMNKVKAINA